LGILKQPELKIRERKGAFIDFINTIQVQGILKPLKLEGLGQK
jgi:hypothetical protein